MVEHSVTVMVLMTSHQVYDDVRELRHQAADQIVDVTTNGLTSRYLIRSVRSVSDKVYLQRETTWYIIMY